MSSDIIFIIFDVIYIILLTTASVTDIKYRKIPNKINIIILLLALIKSIIQLALFGSKDIFSSLAGFTVALIFVGIPYLLHDNMGAGDLKLSAFSGIYLGFYHTLTLLAVSYISCAIFAAVINVFKRITKKPKITTLPFAPFVLFGSLYLFAINYILK